MEIGSSLSNELGRYLDLSTRQIQVTAGNMANIDTPGYHALGLDFESEMRQAVADSASSTATPESGLAMSSGAGFGQSAPKIFEVDGLVVRPDGNNVSMDREGLNLAEAQLKFKTGVALLRREFMHISDAIHADAK